MHVFPQVNFVKMHLKDGKHMLKTSLNLYNFRVTRYLLLQTKTKRLLTDGASVTNNRVPTAISGT